MWIGLGLKTPVSPGPEIGGPQRRVEDAFDLVVLAGLDQQHVEVRILGKAPRDDRPGRARAADDEIVIVLQIGAEARLIFARAPGEFLLLIGERVV